MPNSKVRPIVAFTWPDMNNHVGSLDDRWQLADHKWQEFDYSESGITRNINDRDYWHARRAFLNSYRLSEEKELFKEKLKRSVKEVNEAAKGVVSGIRKELCKRKVGFRVFRLKFALSSMVLVRIRCFTPWLEQKRLD